MVKVSNFPNRKKVELLEIANLQSLRLSRKSLEWIIKQSICEHLKRHVMIKSS